MLTARKINDAVLSHIEFDNFTKVETMRENYRKEKDR